MFDVEELDLLDKPPVDSIRQALEKLFVLGFIDSSCNPTLMGMIVNSIPRIDIKLMRMVLVGFSNKVDILDLITIAELL